MANVFFKKGLLANLPSSYAAGTFYVTTDERAMYLDIDDSTRIRLGDFIQVDAVSNLPTSGASTSALYYCVAENILAKWNGSDWTQINKQPTAEEMKTLLGLGSLAYLSEVGESNLSSDLQEKINLVAEGNHSHSNKGILDGITAEKVSAWDSAEGNAKSYADTEFAKDRERLVALEAVDHEHSNKALLDTYTQTESDLADAVAKKHSHSFNETELNKIVEGDVAKWNGVAADHLTSADKTTLENAIKEAKKAGTDANTNIETYKVTNDARVLAVEEDIAEIVDGANGILAQAKSYSDGKLATARTEISAEIDADVKVVADELAGYKSSNDTALAGVKATADAAASKAYTDEELNKKVDKVEGKSLISDSEITRLAGMSDGANKVEKSNTNGNIKIDGEEVVVYTHPEKHSISEVDGLQAALDGKQAAGNYSEVGHKHVKADITDFAHTHVSSEITDLDTTIKSYDYATKTELGDVDKKFENYKTAEAQKAIDDEQDRRLGVIEGDYLKAADIANFETKENVKKVADDLAAYVESNDEALAGVKATADAAATKAYTDGELAKKADKSVVDAMYTNAQIDELIAAETTRATGIEGGLDTRIKAIEDDYLKGEHKTALEGLITAEETRAKGVEESLQTQINTIMNNPDAEGAINSINEFTQYVKDHGTIADGFRSDIDKNKEDIAANAKAISDHETLASQTYETKADASQKLVDAKAYADGVVATEKSAREAADAELSTAIEDAKTAASNQDAVVLAEAQQYCDIAKAEAEAKAAELDAALKSALQAEIDSDVKVVNDALEGYKTSNDAAVALKANAADVYGKSETFTKEEVNAAIEAAVTSACCWGEF